MKNIYKKVNDFIKENIILFLIIVFVLYKVLYSGNNIRNDVVQPLARNYVATKTMALDSAVDFTNKKIAQNFSLTLSVDNVVKYQEDITELVKKYNGYIENFNSYINNNNQVLSLNIKIPSKNVNNYIKDIKGDNYVKSESYYTIDHTERYNDNENRLKNLYTRRDKLRNMMNTAKNITDIIAVEKELNNVQLEIERLEKSNLNIDKDVEYSNVNLTIEENIKNIDNNWSIKKSINEAVNLLISVCFALINCLIIFITFLPLILLFIILLFLVKKSYFYIKNRKNGR